MAKTRVSHLAKEFNLDVKELILRLREINIEVDNYLSSIEATDVARARDMLAKAVPLVEEQRVGTHIKRRRAMARPKPAMEKPAAPDIPAGEQPTSSAAEAEKTAIPEGASSRSKGGISLASPLKRRRVADKPAKIIALPETPKPAPPAAAKRPPVAEASPPAPAAQIPVPSAPELTAPPELQPETAMAPVETPQETPAAESPEVPLAAEAPEPVPAAAEAKPQDPASALKRQKAKKAKKDTPARIISLPKPGEKVEAEAAAASAPAAPAAPARRPPRVIEVVNTTDERPAPAAEKDD